MFSETMSWMELSGGQFISMRRSLLEESYTNVTRMSPDSMSGFLRLCYSKDTKEMKEVRSFMSEKNIYDQTWRQSGSGAF